MLGWKIVAIGDWGIKNLSAKALRVSVVIAYFFLWANRGKRARGHVSGEVPQHPQHPQKTVSRQPSTVNLFVTICHYRLMTLFRSFFHSADGGYYINI